MCKYLSFSLACLVCCQQYSRANSLEGTDFMNNMTILCYLPLDRKYEVVRGPAFYTQGYLLQQDT